MTSAPIAPLAHRIGFSRTALTATIRPWQPSGNDLLRHYLDSRDVPCPACSYNLRGLGLDHCPECGETLFLAVRGLDETTSAALVRLLAAALPLGFNAIFTMIGLVGAAFSHSWRPGDWLLVGMFGALSVALAVVLWRVQRTMPGFRRRPRRSQWKRAFGLALIVFAIQVAAIAFMFVVR